MICCDFSTGPFNLTDFIEFKFTDPTTDIRFNYQELEITASDIHIGWDIVEDFTNCSLFVVQRGMHMAGSTMPIAIADDNIVSTTSTYAVIPHDQFADSEAVFRIIAVDENGTVCSNNKSQRSFYRFNGMKIYKVYIHL